MHVKIFKNILTLSDMGFFDPCSHGGGPLWAPLYISETIYAISMKLGQVADQSIFNILVKKYLYKYVT